MTTGDPEERKGLRRPWRGEEQPGRRRPGGADGRGGGGLSGGAPPVIRVGPRETRRRGWEGGLLISALGPREGSFRRFRPVSSLGLGLLWVHGGRLISELSGRRFRGAGFQPENPGENQGLGLPWGVLCAQQFNSGSGPQGGPGHYYHGQPGHRPLLSLPWGLGQLARAGRPPQGSGTGGQRPIKPRPPLLPALLLAAHSNGH